MDKRILIVPDLHLRRGRIDDVIHNIAPTLTVFLGDYFDQFDDSVSQNEDQAAWLRWSLKQPDRFHLMGNHDLHYAFPDRFHRGPGFSEEKHAAIGKHMKMLEWTKLHMFFSAGQFLMCHGGLQISHIPGTLDLDKLPDWLAEQELDCWDALHRGRRHWISSPGRDRPYGMPLFQDFGGLVWADLKSLVPLPGWNQVVGHTPAKVVRMTDSPDSAIVCLDTVDKHDRMPRFLGVLDDDEVFYLIESEKYL